MFLRISMSVAIALILLQPAAFSAAGNSADLANAAKNRDIATVRSLIKPGVDVNALGADGTPALHWLVSIDDVETVKLLIRAGGDVNLASRYGVTTMALACANANAEMVRVLLDAGADPNSVDQTTEPALWSAIRGGSVDAVRLLLDRKASLTFKDGSQQTSLMLAVRENRPDIVKLLVERGADVLAKTRVGAIPGFVLPNSVPGFGNGIGIVRGGSPPRGRRDLIPGGMSALLYAARDGRVDAARILLESGANLKETDPNGVTPLIMAISNNQMPMAHFLLERGAEINVVDWYGRTPLWQAVETRNMDLHNSTIKNDVDRAPVLELIKVLLERGAEPNPRMKEAFPIRKFMLPTTGSLSWVDFTGQTPFLTAALAGDVTVMKLLLQHGADPKIPTFAGTTALMAAAGINWVVAQTYDEGQAALLEAVKLCFELGMDVNDKNSMGLTAVMGAANRGSDEIIKWLVAHGAKLDAKDNEGRTPLTWAEGVFLATHAPVPKPASMALIKELMAK